MRAEMRLLDDEVDFEIGKFLEEECEKALESISKQMKSRVLLPKQTIYVSTTITKNDFLSAFKYGNLHDNIVDSFNHAVVTYWNFDTHYRILKPRKKKNRR